MPRPPVAKEGEPTKTFIVKPGFIIGDNQNRRRTGLGTLPGKTDVEGQDLIELTYEQAKYFREMGAIDVPLEDFSNEPAVKDDPTETSDGDQANGAGESGVGDAPEKPAVKAKRKI